MKTKQLALTNEIESKKLEFECNKFNWEKENYSEEFALKKPIIERGYKACYDLESSGFRKKATEINAYLTELQYIQAHE